LWQLHEKFCSSTFEEKGILDGVKVQSLLQLRGLKEQLLKVHDMVRNAVLSAPHREEVMDHVRATVELISVQPDGIVKRVWPWVEINCYTHTHQMKMTRRMESQLGL
jgi:hypothetical protein